MNTRALNAVNKRAVDRAVNRRALHAVNRRALNVVNRRASEGVESVGGVDFGYIRLGQRVGKTNSAIAPLGRSG